jgi:hypothetical protein
VLKIMYVVIVNEVNVFLVHAMNAHAGGGGLAPILLNLPTRWR